jgi:putative adhesin
MRSISRPLMLMTVGLFASALAAAAPVKNVHKTVPLAADGRLEISTYKGSIDVTTWDRPEAEITARVEPDSSSDDSADLAARKVDETRIEIDGGGSSVRVKSDYSRVKDGSIFWIFGNHGTLPFVHYTVKMPATARLEIDDYKSDSRVTGLRADLKLHTYKGQVRVEGLDGAAVVDTYKGDVRVHYARYAHASRFETYKGEVEVRLPRDSRFELDAHEGRRGSVDSDFETVERAGLRRSTSMRGAINGGGPALRFETSKGTLRLRKD